MGVILGMIPRADVCPLSTTSNAICVSKQTRYHPPVNMLRRRDVVSNTVMGPVVASLVMYAAERLISRLVAGQILRKGVSRKIRILVRLMMTESVLHDVLSDFLEDMSDLMATNLQ